MSVTRTGMCFIRFVAGADAVQTIEQKARDLLAQADAYRALSSTLAHDDA